MILSLLFLLVGTFTFAQVSEKTFEGLEFRLASPAFNSGRISDIAIDPNNENIWYVTVASGGVWKTENSGTTWTSIFEGQGSYSIGCVTIDPSNSSTIWVGTGENDGGRHIGFGDGIYVSYDAGKSWNHKGLKSSEHISKIIVDPTNSDVIYVASQGPLWSKGGERGVYKSTNGGDTWENVLSVNEWTGATDLLIDYNDPSVLYAATWQRHRTVAAYLGGGPGTGLYRSDDSGKSWKKLTNGIPNVNMGKIGLAMSYFNPSVVYAAIELERKKGGVFMSDNRGETWTKMSDAVGEGTGPHYYQELYASPHQDGKLYFMSNTSQISEDHGKTFTYMNEKNKHGDSHAMAFRLRDPDYVLFGTDGGLYESYDDTKTWKFIPNLPLTQYYKVEVDDAEPFYNLYGGTQDNGSHGGPSQTLKTGGIYNRDWKVTLAADGHDGAIEPGNPDISYGEFQQGRLWRIDHTTGENVFIQPQPRKGEPYERFNWDAPILVSPHKPTRLYFASYRVWKSEDRGDSWEPISSDLTKNQNRMQLPIMGGQQSWDNAWDVTAMSSYNTITSIAESPVKEGVIFIGTDDGLIQYTKDGGANWTKVAMSSIKGIPATAFVNDIRADLYDENTVYAALDNHKYGDYKPYLIKTRDGGKTWTSMNGDLPSDKLLTWRLVQDHVDKNLLFVATEFGIYFTKNEGQNWIKLTGGLPTISFRDITIQRREDDLVTASFGRGMYILDDISPIREFKPEMQSSEGVLFDVQDALWYVPEPTLLGQGYGQGDDDFAADNPPFGAIFTYYLPSKIETLEGKRKAKEKSGSVTFPDWESLTDEVLQTEPKIFLVVKNDEGEVVKMVEGSNKQGFTRVNWEFDYAQRTYEKLTPDRPSDGYFVFFSNGALATPGAYTVTLTKLVDGELTELSDPKSFEVKRLKEGAITPKSSEKIDAFRDSFQSFQTDLTATSMKLNKSMNYVSAMERAVIKAEKPSKELFASIYQVRMKLSDLKEQLQGNPAKNAIGERSNPTPGEVGFLGLVALSTTYGPTPTHESALALAQERLSEISTSLNALIQDDFTSLQKQLEEVGAPMIEPIK